MYHVTDTTVIILRIMRAYNWKRVSLVGHSLGAIMCYMFIGVYPEMVDLFVALDALQPSYPGDILEQQAYQIERALVADVANIKNKFPKEYTHEQMIEKIHNGLASKIPRELCHHLLVRNITASKLRPEKYYFRQDNRSKHPNVLGWSRDTNSLTARSIRCPVLIIKASESIFYSDHDECMQLINLMRKVNSHIKLATVAGCHYVHLIEPERVANVITDFLNSCQYFRKSFESKL